MSPQRRASTEDPLRRELLSAGAELPERILRCVEPVTGEAAFDPGLIDRTATRIELPQDARFEHPLLERAVRVGLAHIETTFRGDHPKYGVGVYAGEEHDSFPPTIVAVVDALTLWGMMDRAGRLFAYWLATFVRRDGTIDYYGPSLSEYGQMLATARRLAERSGSTRVLAPHADALGRLAAYLLDVVREGGGVRLAAGVPEADERESVATYFHNNAWIVRGLEDWAELLAGIPGRGGDAAAVRQDASRLRGALMEALNGVWPDDPSDWWLRPTAEDQAQPETITASRLGSYTNYRYWPELLSSGVLPRALMERVVRARLASGGDFLGTSRFEGWLDDWPLSDYLDGLWRLGRTDEFRLSLWGHIRCHQAQGHLTAYEQVTLPPGRKVADYCLPCQLVAVRAAGYLAGRRRNTGDGGRTVP